MSPSRWLFAVGAVGLIACALWPPSPALSSNEMLQARLACAALTGVSVAAIGLAKGGRGLVWLAFAIVSAVGAVATLIAHFDASGSTGGCVASYDGHPTLIGREYTPLGLEHIRDNPGTTDALLLLDAGGVATLVWTPASVWRCRFWLSWGALIPIPLFAISVGSLIARRRPRFAIPPRKGAAVAPSPLTRIPVYDAFLSYRHSEPDKSHAITILESLEGRDLRVAIDVRDFAPNEHFLSEMERCIRESRFVLCVITSHYLDSDHTSEEAIISKTLDMAERRKRLVPLIFERVELPVWLYGVVGIDFTATAGVEPLDRVLDLLLPGRVGANLRR